MIFFLYCSAMELRYSGLISVLANWNEAPLKPARWHSITVEVRMGTWWLGNFEMLLATRINMRAAEAWSPILMWDLTRMYECNVTKLRYSSCEILICWLS